MAEKSRPQSCNLLNSGYGRSRVKSEFIHVYFDRTDLPDLGPFTRFEFPTIGTVYDANGQPLIELAQSTGKITQYEDIPPIVRDAILADRGQALLLA